LIWFLTGFANYICIDARRNGITDFNRSATLLKAVNVHPQ
jgi:hypothetical protein